jgi:nucleoside-diphosphate-sugar epimerase
MKILVTGSEGNIGKVLVPYLKYKEHDVFCIDIQQKFEDGYRTVDINNGADIISAFYEFRPDVVFHMAAMVSRVTCEYSPVTTIKTNVCGTENVIQLCKQVGAKLIFFSTSEVYGDIGGTLSEGRTDLKPNNIYGLSKLMSEQLVTYEVVNGLKAIIVRPFMFYHEDETFGNHRSAIIRFVVSLLKHQKIIVHKNSYRSWMHLDDAVVVLEKLCYVANSDIVTINIGNPELHSMDVVANKICSKLGLIYADYVVEEELPEKMTLNKVSNFTVQKVLTRYNCMISLDEGIDRVIKKVREKL